MLGDIRIPDMVLNAIRSYAGCFQAELAQFYKEMLQLFYRAFISFAKSIELDMKYFMTITI